MRPGEALGALARGGAMRARRGWSSASRRSASASASGSPGAHELAVDAVAHDVAVAGDVGGEHRRGRGERLGQDHAEALAAERRRAQHVGARQLGAACAASETLPSARTPRSSSIMCATSSRRGADERERRRDVVAQRLEGAQQHRQALALDGLADEQDAQRGRPPRSPASPRAAQRQLGVAGDVHAVGDDAVAPAVEAPGGPGGGLGHGDAHVQAVHAPAPAERDGGDRRW